MTVLMTGGTKMVGMKDDEPRGLLPLPPQLGSEQATAALPLFARGDSPDEAFLGNLLGHPVQWRPATLPDHRTTCLKTLYHPVIVPAEGESVEGHLILELDAEDFRRLDAYSGVGEGLFQRTEVTALMDDAPQCACAYLPTAKTLTRYGRTRTG